MEILSAKIGYCLTKWEVDASNWSWLVVTVCSSNHTLASARKESGGKTSVGVDSESRGRQWKPRDWAACWRLASSVLLGDANRGFIYCCKCNNFSSMGRRFAEDSEGRRKNETASRKNRWWTSTKPLYRTTSIFVHRYVHSAEKRNTLGMIG